jgi:hypothetical protein
MKYFLFLLMHVKFKLSQNYLEFSKYVWTEGGESREEEGRRRETRTRTKGVKSFNASSMKYFSSS